MTAERADDAETLYRDHARRHRAIFGDIVLERIRQESMWGVQEHGGSKWYTIMAEEFGEIAKSLNELGATAADDGDAIRREAQHLREEIVQTLAVGAAWLEDFDRREGWW